jgi:small neutral amino acid transporter SnatA (MarC family)
LIHFITADSPASRALRAGLVLALALALSFAVVAPPESCPPVTAGELRQSAQASVDWFVRNQNPDGTWLYLYDRRDDSAPDEYNAVRHVGAAMGLYRAAAEGLPSGLRSADRGTEWALNQLLERDGWAAIDWIGTVDTGATALMTAGLVLRRDATNSMRYDAVLRRMGRFLVAQTQPSGAVLASYDPVRGRPVPDKYSKYYTGESYWALALLHRAFPADPEWGEAADRIGAYLATSRDQKEGHWPPIADHWAGYGLAETVDFPERGRPPLTEDEVDYARSQAGLFGGQVRWTAQRFGPWGALVRGSHVPRGGGYGVVDEGLTGLWLAARKDPRLGDLREPIAERATCMAGLAVDTQSDARDAAAYKRPGRVEGAWFRDGETRMDDQQHALAGLLRTIPIVEARGADGSEDKDAPSGWLWAAALLLALNPARGVFGIPRAGRSRREITRVAAVGGAIGGIGACVAAVLADPLLDAVDVSDPSFRTAAAAVAVIAGIADLFRSPPSPEPALPGRRAALIPVAIPIVASPAVLMLALGAGADLGVAVTAAAMAVGVVVLAALADRAPPSGAGGRALRWAGRLLAAGLVAAGVVLGIDGIFAV